MSILQRKDELLAKFPEHVDWEGKYRFIIDFGKKLPVMPSAMQQDKFLVKGCMSRAWLYPEFKEGRVYFHGDSEAQIVKGIIAMLLFVYSNSTPEEILALSPEFLQEVGVKDHLSLSRRNGLASFTKQIQLYAAVFKSMAAQGVVSQQS